GPDLHDHGGVHGFGGERLEPHVHCDGSAQLTSALSSEEEIMKTRPILFVGLLLAAPLTAQNVLSNPSFVSDVSGWSFPSYDTGVWDPFSRDAGSGSAHITSLVRPGTLDAPNTSAEQCVEVIAGRTYVFGGHVYIPGNVASAEAI